MGSSFFAIFSTVVDDRCNETGLVGSQAILIPTVEYMRQVLFINTGKKIR